MTIEVWLAYVVTTIVLLVIPGPTILAVIGYSLSHGNKVKIPLVLAVALGDSTALALSLIGLGAVLSQSAFWFQVVKWVGGLYLLYLGTRMIIGGLRATSGVTTELATSELKRENRHAGKQVFLNTYITTVLNPKGIIFFVAFLPQFVNPAAPVYAQLWILAITFVVLAIVNAAIYAIFAGKARQLIAGSETRKAFNIGGGSLLAGAGVWALRAEL